MALWDFSPQSAQTAPSTRQARTAPISCKQAVLTLIVGGFVFASTWMIAQTAVPANGPATAVAPTNGTPGSAAATAAATQSADQPNPPAVDRKTIVRQQSAELLQLAKDLQSEVNKTDVGALSVPVIRKADEIDKLTHQLKDKHKLAAGIQ